MRFRKMIPSDLIHVMPLFRALWKEMEEDSHYPLYPKQSVEDDETSYMWALRLIQVPSSACFVCIPEGRIAKGFIFGEVGQRRIGLPKIVGTGYHLFVDPKFRGQGVGEELLKLWAGRCFELGAEALEAEYIPGTSAHRMWALAGFKSFAATGVFVDENWNILKEAPTCRRKAEAVVEEKPPLASQHGQDHSLITSSEEMPARQT